MVKTGIFTLSLCVCVNQDYRCSAEILSDLKHDLQTSYFKGDRSLPPILESLNSLGDNQRHWVVAKGEALSKSALENISCI